MNCDRAAKYVRTADHGWCCFHRLLPKEEGQPRQGTRIADDYGQRLCAFKMLNICPHRGNDEPLTLIAIICRERLHGCTALHHHHLLLRCNVIGTSRSFWSKPASQQHHHQVPQNNESGWSEAMIRKIRNKN